MPVRPRAGLSGGAAGCGIWTTHFVAMLAFDTGLPTAYALGLTSLSLALANLSTTLFARGTGAKAR